VSARVIRICADHLTYVDLWLLQRDSLSVLSLCKTGRELRVQGQLHVMVWSMLHYFPHCSLAFVILHADALTNCKDPIIRIISVREYALIRRWRCTGFVHYIG
jgi:hypothetical protein